MPRLPTLKPELGKERVCSIAQPRDNQVERRTPNAQQRFGVMAKDQIISMKKITATFLLTLISVFAYGQKESKRKKSLFLEIAGSCGFLIILIMDLA